MKKKNNSIKTIFLILLVLLGITSGITVLHNNSNNSDVNLNSSSGLINDVNSSGIAILKKIESGVTSEGYPYQTYSYEITPEDTTFKTIKVKSLEYATTPSEDDAEASEILDVSINNTASTFTVNKIQDFDNQIILTLCCEMDENVCASLLVDCEQRWLGFNTDVNYTRRKELDNVLYSSLTIHDYLKSMFYIMEDNYSVKYTIPIDYSDEYSYEDCSVAYSLIDNSTSLVYLNTITSEDGYSETTEYNDIRTIDISENGANNIKTSVNALLNGDDSLTYDQFISDCLQEYLNTQKEIRTLIDESDGFGFITKVNVTFTIGSNTVNFDMNIVVSTAVNNFVVNPTSLNLESNSIIF